MPAPQRRSRAVRRLLIVLAAVASIYLVRATGLDQGLIDEALDAAVEVVAPAVSPEASKERQSLRNTDPLYKSEASILLNIKEL